VEDPGTGAREVPVVCLEVFMAMLFFGEIENCVRVFFARGVKNELFSEDRFTELKLTNLLTNGLFNI